MAQDIYQGSFGEARREVESLCWTVGFLSPSLNLFVGFDDGVARVVAVHERGEELMYGIEDCGGIFIEREVLQLRTAVGVD